jgi:hypothetical protein
MWSSGIFIGFVLIIAGSIGAAGEDKNSNEYKFGMRTFMVGSFLFISCICVLLWKYAP